VAAGGAEIVMRAAWLCALLAFAGLADAVAVKQDTPSLDAFADAIHHWRNVHGDKYPRHAPDAVAKIADTILLYQRLDGGWKENEDPARILDEETRARFAEEAKKSGGSFDNRNTYTQFDYLATAHAITGDPRYRDGALRGLEFILAHQIASCGGWPHTVPPRESYHPRITFADDVTAGVLGTLRKVVDDRRRHAFVDGPLLARVQAAIARGDACVLRLQVRQGDRLAGWAGQYDETTLQPAQGRKFELPAIAVQETVGVVGYLMSIRSPSPEVIAAVEGAVQWLRQVELRGWRLETFEAPAEQFRYHETSKDRRLVADASARGLWARFHDLNDNSVVLADRDGRRLARYEDVTRERRTGYAWYGDWPRGLLDRDHPAWQARQARAAAK
jgi:PelA/Pel-15E family pectate lyase